MKFIIEGSQSELTELIKRLGGIETEKKKDYIPPLLTELAEDEKIHDLAEAIRNADKENAPQAEAAKQEQPLIPFLTKDLGNRGYRTEHKENATRAEATKQEYVDPIAFEETVCKFADWIRNRPVKNGKIHKYRDMKLSEFIQGDLLRAAKINS